MRLSLRIHALFSVFLGLASHTGAGREVEAGERSRPNILVILTDDMGYVDLGVHGAKGIPTPNMDALAEGGIRFRSGYVSGPVCGPSRCGLVTGRYQQRFGAEFNPHARPSATPQGITPRETTIADRLKAAGYTTGLIGKWHAGHIRGQRPLDRGFDEFFGFFGGAHFYFAPWEPHGIYALRKGTKIFREPEYLTYAFARDAGLFIERHCADPWFLLLSFNAVHTPMQAPDDLMEEYAHVDNYGRRTYIAMQVALDRAIGMVMDKLRETGQEEDTLIFFVNDNGGTPINFSDNGHLKGHKGTTWEGGIRVPFFISWKGTLTSGQVFDDPVIQLDILPTALAAAGVAIDPAWELDGKNLLPYLTGDAEGPPHEALYWRYGWELAIRKGRWKLVKSDDMAPPAKETIADEATADGAILIDLLEDPSETRDLSAQHPAIRKELVELWNRWNSELPQPAWQRKYSRPMQGDKLR